MDDNASIGFTLMLDDEMNTELFIDDMQDFVVILGIAMANSDELTEMVSEACRLAMNIDNGRRAELN